MKKKNVIYGTVSHINKAVELIKIHSLHARKDGESHGRNKENPLPL